MRKAKLKLKFNSKLKTFRKIHFFQLFDNLKIEFYLCDSRLMITTYKTTPPTLLKHINLSPFSHDYLNQERNNMKKLYVHNFFLCCSFNVNNCHFDCKNLLWLCLLCSGL